MAEELDLTNLPPENIEVPSLDVDLIKAIDDSEGVIPNLDEVMDKVLAKGENPDFQNQLNDNADPAASSSQTQAPSSVDFIENTFGLFKQQLGDAFEVPKEVTKENFLDKVFEGLMPFYQKTLDPKVLEIQNHLQAGGSLEDYLAVQRQVVDIKSMPADDLLFEYYKEQMGKSEQNPNGLSEDQIKAYLSKKDPVEKTIEANGVKNALLKQQELQREIDRKNAAESKQKEYETYINTLKTDAINTVKKVGDVKEVFGIPVTKQEVDSFNSQFEKLIVPDESGMSVAQKILYDDTALYKLLFVASRSGYIKDLVTDAQNKGLKDLKQNLSGLPNNFQQNMAWNSQQGPDLDALSRPAKY